MNEEKIKKKDAGIAREGLEWKARKPAFLGRGLAT
jgi:hypothetical protein